MNIYFKVIESFVDTDTIFYDFGLKSGVDWCEYVFKTKVDVDFCQCTESHSKDGEILKYVVLSAQAGDTEQPDFNVILKFPVSFQAYRPDNDFIYQMRYKDRECRVIIHEHPIFNAEVKPIGIQIEPIFP